MTFVLVKKKKQQKETPFLNSFVFFQPPLDMKQPLLNRSPFKHSRMMSSLNFNNCMKTIILWNQCQHIEQKTKNYSGCHLITTLGSYRRPLSKGKCFPSKRSN
jgi:hypothetical protein